MRSFTARDLPFIATVALTLALTLSFSTSTHAQTFNILHNFGAAGDGNTPTGPLVKDTAGKLYGVTGSGGAHNSGTVYRLSPLSTGGFKETILYSFKGGSADGASPQGTLVRDSAGNLYGVTQVGGINATACTSAAGPGCGVIFKLTPTTTGAWTETILHRFTGADGGNSFAGLVLDSKGNFYGATPIGGSKGMGTVFKLSLTSTGWKETVLHNFTGGTDGASPMMFQTALTLDGLGNIYGSTYSGGSSTEIAGVIFELIPQTTGAWTEKILHTFQSGADGSEPLTGVILDKSGNVYGTTLKGGTQLGSGVVFKLTAAKGYAKTVLHDFNAITDPARSNAHGLFFDASGNIFGTTEYALYKLTPGPTGWTETLLMDFDEIGGVPVYAPAIMDAQGHIWGTTLLGGQSEGGFAWEFIP